MLNYADQIKEKARKDLLNLLEGVKSLPTFCFFFPHILMCIVGPGQEESGRR